MTSPANQTRESILAASKAGSRLFRQNTGLAWAASKTWEAKQSGPVLIQKGWRVMEDPRPFKAGTPGMFDATGWTSVTITPDMVGQKIAVYTAVEDKQGTGRLSTEQRAFGLAVLLAGGRAGVSRSPDETTQIVTGAALGLGLSR